MSYAKTVLENRNQLVQLIIDFAKDINGADIDFGALTVDEDSLYKTLALSLADNADIDWTKLSQYELEDMTEGTQQLACVGGACSIL